MSILAIDPGPVESAYALIEEVTCRPLKFGKVPNTDMLGIIQTACYDRLSIEMIASYGMAVGREVFDTCVWIGRFVQVADGEACALVVRKDVKMHHCHSNAAKDSNIIQALVDRFAYGVPNRGKGSKAAPGWFYGFAADVWQAFALAVYTADVKYANSGKNTPFAHSHLP